MKKISIAILIILCTTGLQPAIPANAPGDSLQKKAHDLREKVKKIQENYSTFFKIHLIFKQEFKQIKNQLELADELIAGGNYPNAINLLQQVEETLYTLAKNPDSPPPPPKIEQRTSPKVDICREARKKSYQANRARYDGREEEAIALFYQVVQADCLDRKDPLVIEAEHFIKEKKEYIWGFLSQAKDLPQEVEKRNDLYRSIKAALEAIRPYEPGWVQTLETQYPHLAADASPSGSIPPPGKQQPLKQEEKENPPGPRPGNQEPAGKPFNSGSVAQTRDETFYDIALDIWQSAWGQDFNETSLAPLIEYLRKNNIRKINLNPGLTLEPKLYDQALDKLQPLVQAFYAAGIEKINFLYAEIGYPIRYYARFLQEHPELKIDTIVDDSEFTDTFKDTFQKNRQEVNQWGIKYSAFITLETLGNSGVSDALRYWALENVDCPILMSYFGCTLEQQKASLEKYLTYADGKGKKESVGIAILLGSKSFGREVSCEKLLKAEPLQRFIADLHQWAKQNHPSYGGIVLETNLKMPRVDLYRGLEQEKKQGQGQEQDRETVSPRQIDSME